MASTATKLMSVIVRIEVGFTSQDGKIETGGIIETNRLSKDTHRITLVAGEGKKKKEGLP